MKTLVVGFANWVSSIGIFMGDKNTSQKWLCREIQRIYYSCQFQQDWNSREWHWEYV